MPTAAVRNPLAEPAGYANNWECLSDWLGCLDLRLRRQILERPDTPDSDPYSSFAGLVITDAEICRLLPSSPNATRQLDGDRAEQQKLEHALEELQTEVQLRQAAALRAGVDLALPRLAELFGLTAFEEQCLIICLAPELDRKYEKLYAYIQDDANRTKPGVGLVLNLLCGSQAEKLSARTAFDPQAPLFKFKLLQIDLAADGQKPLLSRAIKLDDRVVNFLLGHDQLDARLERLAQKVLPHEGDSGAIDGHELYQRVLDFVEGHFPERSSTGRNLVLCLHGPANLDKRPVVDALCHKLALPLIVADVEAIKAGQLPFGQAMWLLARESALQDAVLCLENVDCLVAEPEKHRLELNALMESAAAFSRLTFIFASRPWQPQGDARKSLFLSIAVSRPDLHYCQLLWERSLAAHGRLAGDVDSAVLAGKFRFALNQIQAALIAAENLARFRSADDWQITGADLSAVCRAQSSPRLGSLAQKIEPKYTWKEIVLPRDDLAQLKELCERARYRHRVYGDWGFDRALSLGKGLNALFFGPPGTGKTMAAEVIGSELQLDLYRIDLSQVVSKYIGETEKNLHQIFVEAQAAHAILFFDEADALFGKRSEVKDAHDRYANIEVSYLLQKMEEYEGVAILATNLRENIDEAFLRRIHFIVDFPFPDHEHRRDIWRVAFPREAPLADDVDFEALAREVKLAGGNIKNIALAAAFYAAGDGRLIQMRHLWSAARREHQKLGRAWEFHA